MKQNDLDLDLKFRMMRFLWHIGYYTRHNINLFRYLYGKKTDQSFTDVDVLGIKIDDDLTQHILICDCKSGQSAKTAERIFWLSGLMNYLDADKGIFLRNQVTESRYFDLANKLEITILSLNQFNELEKAYGATEEEFIGPFNKTLLTKEKNITDKLKKKSSRVYNYIYYSYWKDPVQNQIKSLIQSDYEIAKISDIEQNERLFLQTYILSLLSLSIIKFSKPFLMIPKNEKEFYLKGELLGGTLESVERRMLFERFYDFMSSEISKRYDQKYPVSKTDFMSNFYPPYTKYLLDLVERICLNPLVSIQLPKIFDIIWRT